MTGQQVHAFVHGERHIAVGTLWNPTASAALYHRREVASVLKQYHLLPILTQVRDKKIFRKVPIALISLRVLAVPPAYCQRNNRL